MWTKEQSDAIYETGKNIIVSAGAGSGKTLVLSERVLEHVKSGISINRMLILTFTRAAAEEMKRRIRKKLIKNDLREEVNLIDSSFITTFDSYSLSLVKKYHHLLNVSRNINIIDENILKIKVSELLDELLEEEYEKRDPLFVKLISDFCVKDDRLIKKTILNLLDKLNMKYDMDNYLDNYLDNFYNLDNIKNNLLDYVSIIKGKINEINNNLSDISLYVDGDYYSKLLDSLNNLINSNDYLSIKNNIPDKLPNLPKGSEEIVKNKKGIISDLLKEIKDYTKYSSESELIDTYLLTKDYVNELIILIRKLNNKINEFKFNNDLYDFIDISKLAIKVVEENENIRLELRDYFKEILVDEYQDTNDLQEYFINLIGNNNIYMVGDIKQSIYRFRNANPDIFRSKYNNYSTGNGGLKIDLLKNFRSRKEVLDNVNLIFDYIMDDYIGGANYTESHRMVAGNISYDNEGKTNQNYNMEIYTYPYDKELGYKRPEIEAFIIADDILNKVNNHYQVFDKDLNILRDVTFNDFCILIDRSTNFDLYKKIFLYKQIPLSIFRDEQLTSSNLLLVIKNIYKLLDIYVNKKTKEELTYSFLSIGRSFLFEYDDNYLFNVIKNDSFNDTEIMKIIDKISININSKSLTNLFDEIINEFNIYNNIIKIGDIKDNYIKIDYLYDLCSNLNTLGYTYLDFVNYLDKIFENDSDIKFSLSKDDNSSVKIMTIHKSKGLEYHICYFPGLTSAFNTSDLKEKFIYDNKLGIISPYNMEGIGNTFYRDLFKYNYTKEEISEKIRLFYVSLTRVKEKMIFVIPSDDSEIDEVNGVISNEERLAYKSFSDMMISIKEKLSNYIKNINIDSLNLSKDYLLPSEGDVFKKFKKTNDYIETVEYELEEKQELTESHFSKSNISLVNKDKSDVMSFGTKVHYYLEVLDFNNPDYSLIENEYQDKIKIFLNSDLLNNKDKAKFYKEYEFIYQEDNEVKHGFIDLLVEYSDHYDIIDYKLKNIDDLLYDKQLNGYRKYISELSNKKVNCYLYSIMDSTYREVKPL